MILAENISALVDSQKLYPHNSVDLKGSESV